MHIPYYIGDKMDGYTQHFHKKTHKYSFELKYQIAKQQKTATGVIEGDSADAVILMLLEKYPNSTGKVKRLNK